MIQIKKLNTQDSNFKDQLSQLIFFEAEENTEIEKTVAEILSDVKKRGDQAVIEYTKKFDHADFSSMEDFEISKEELNLALESLPKASKDALEEAAKRVFDYHNKQLMSSWSYTEDDQTLLGQKVTSLDRVGLYVPGGKAAYPSSVLMNAIPAKVAGVKEIIMVVPSPYGERNQLVLAAAALVKVDRVFSIGGAQAIGALAYGTQTIPQVDKIVGPGNAYVAEAKRRVFGVVGIDMVAGPSEILIIADEKSNPDWIAMDLFSQAEHDELAQSILISPSDAFLNQVQESINKLIDTMPRKKIIETSLENRGAMIKVKNLEEAAEISNFISPEHLELSVDDPDMLVNSIKHAGAIFMGRNTCEAVGDYCAGPNHVLPTSRTARFSSPLGVYDFQKRSSLIKLSHQGARKLGKIASVLAHGEGLQAHAKSAEYRIDNE
ncbi:MAG: bifunctional histidinal dehydrogenase and histidinol dehydrogenase [Pseudomonadota bacterium]|jgi:histidinol dehydrogenase